MASNDEKASSSSSSSSSSWWGNFLKVAKEKSSSTFEIIKHDFAEFTTTMSNDTSSLLKSAKNNPIINSLLSTDDNEEEKNEQPTRIKKDSKLSTATTIQDRYKQDLLLLQSNESTYLSDPSHENFKEWSEKFDPETFKATISELLIDDSSMRSLFSQLVPAQISNIQFWSRYFFKVKQLEDEHKNRLKLLEKAENDAEVAKDKLEDLDWGDDNNEGNAEAIKETKTTQNEPIHEIKTKQEIPNETKESTNMSITAEKVESKPEESSDDWEVTSDIDIKLKREESENKKLKQEQEQEQDQTDSIASETIVTVNSESNRKNEKIKDKTQKEEQEDAEWDDWE